MKLFEFNETYSCDFTYPEHCKYIWEQLNKLGNPRFGKRELEDLWRDFSEERYCAVFMMPNDILVKEFANWLVKKEENR